MKMKRILCNIIAAAALLASFASCQKPHYVEPTAERDGFTSLSAYFTSGEYVNSELAKLEVTDEMIKSGVLVVKVPYYYPEPSENSTAVAMSRVRMKAELGKNCYLTPSLTILDLNEENEFTYTDAKGNTYPIIITGRRTKFHTASFVSFELVDMFEGFIDNDERKIYLYTNDDLASCTAKAVPYAHSEVITDLSVARNYNEPQTIVIRAQDGTDYEYVTEKAKPTKIRNGFNANSVKQLFSIDPKSRLGTPEYQSTGIYASLASIEGYLVVCLGDGSTPFYIHGTTAEKLGEINLGSAEAASITSDEAGHMLIVNAVDKADSKLRIYRTSSVTAAPELFYEYDNQTPLPVGRKMKVSGDIDGNAVITLPYGGVSGVTESSQFLSLTVTGGSVTEAKVIDLAPAGLSWSVFPASATGVAPASSSPSAGYFAASYMKYNEIYNRLDYINADGGIVRTIGYSDAGASNYNATVVESKSYNNVQYLALFVLGYFPGWGGHPFLYVYNVSNKGKLNGYIPESDALVVADVAIKSNNGAGTDSSMSTGDVIIAPSADGFKIFIYYYDQFSGVIGGYTADCIKRN